MADASSSTTCYKVADGGTMTTTKYLGYEALNFGPKDADKDLPKNKLCFVWRHARWFIAIEGETEGMMFPLKNSEATEISCYDVGRWGYPKNRKNITKRQGGKKKAIELMLERFAIT